MSPTAAAKKRLIALHGWSATVLALLLYVVMLTGTIIVFDNEIRLWSEGLSDMQSPLRHETGPLVERFAAQTPPALHETVRIGRGTGDNVMLQFSGRATDREGHAHTFLRAYEVNPRNNLLIATHAGELGEVDLRPPSRALEEFLVDLHVRLHVPGRWGLYLSGLAGIAMLVAAITGVMIHRHILKEMFVTERPGKRLVSFRDRHNLAGVWSLPFAVLLAFTGAFLSFATSLGLPVVAMSAFGGDQEQAINAVLGERPAFTAEPAPIADIDTVFALAATRMNSFPGGAEIRHYGTANAEVRTFHSAPQGALRSVTLRFDGTTGTFLGRAQLVGTTPSAGNTMAELISPLHFGTFAGLWSRFLWAAMGAAMTYTIVSGLQLWLRRRADSWRGGANALITTVWGLPIALCGAAYGYFLTRLTGDPAMGTNIGFLCTALGCIAASAIWPAFTIKHLQRVLGIALLGLPLIRLQTGGLSWGEALVFDAHMLLFIETLCLIGGALFVWSSRRNQADATPVVAE